MVSPCPMRSDVSFAGARAISNPDPNAATGRRSPEGSHPTADRPAGCPHWRWTMTAVGHVEAISRSAAGALIGRQEELADLQAAFEAARSGRPTIALLTGEAGIGKTRLADEAARAGAREWDPGAPR